MEIQSLITQSKKSIKRILTDEEIDDIRHKIENPRYIKYDFETDTSTLTHVPNHVEIAVLQVSDDHDYANSLVDTCFFNGYGCETKVCDCLFTPENSSSTVIAHNGAGYETKFILKYCLSRGLNPDKYIRQGSRITYMYFRKFNLRFIDSVNFFLQPLKKLSDTYSIDTLKGFFPHHFNTHENQNYIGKIPDEEFYGPSNMSEKDL